MDVIVDVTVEVVDEVTMKNLPLSASSTSGLASRSTRAWLSKGAELITDSSAGITGLKLNQY